MIPEDSRQEKFYGKNKRGQGGNGGGRRSGARSGFLNDMKLKFKGNVFLERESRLNPLFSIGGSLPAIFRNGTAGQYSP